MTGIVFFLVACGMSGSAVLDPEGPGSNLSDDTGTVQDSGVDTGSSSEPCGPDEICEITVDQLQLNKCTNGGPSELIVEPVSDQTLRVLHKNVYQGCCPEVSAIGSLDLSTNALTIEYGFDNDYCDCVCMMDVSYTLSDIPEGDHILQAAGDSASIEID